MRHMGTVDAVEALERKCQPRWLLTCLKHSGGVGAVLTIIREDGDMDMVLLATFEHRDVAACGSRCTVKGRTGAIDCCGSVRVGPENQIPGYSHHAAGAAVVHRHGRHWVDG